MTAAINHLKNFAHQVKIHNPLADVEGAKHVNSFRKAAMALPLIGPWVALQFRYNHRFAHTEADLRADRRVLHCELTGAVLQTALIVSLLVASIILGGPIVGAALGLGMTVAGVAYGAYRSYQLTKQIKQLQAQEKAEDATL